MGFRFIKNKKEEEELINRGKQLSEQYERNRQQAQQQAQELIRNTKWVNADTSLGNKIGWVGRNFISGAQGGVLNTISAPFQSMATGFNRGAKQSEQEQNIFDKLKNTGKNAIKNIAYRDVAGRLIYDATLGREDTFNRIMQQAQQLQNNYNQVQENARNTNENPLWTKVKQAGMVIGGATSSVTQDFNPVVQELYNAGQYTGQILGKDKAEQEREKLLKIDENINKNNDEWQEQLAKQGEFYGKGWQTVGGASQSVGNMTPSILLGMVTGGAGASQGVSQALSMAQLGLSAKGQETRKSLKQGADLETAERRGVASGTAEVGSEFMFEGLKPFKTFRENGIEDVAKKYISDSLEKKLKTEVGKKVLGKLADFGVDATGEMIEEWSTDIYNTWLDRATTDPNAEYTLDQFMETGLSTILSTGAINTGYSAINTGLDKIYKRNQDNVNNKVEITPEVRKESNDYKTSLQGMVNNLDIPQQIKDEIQPMLDSNAVVTKEDFDGLKESIKDIVKNNGQIQKMQLLEQAYNTTAIDNQIENLNQLTPEKFNNQESRQFYAQQMNKPLTYNVDTILDAYPENRNGKRTVRQWKDMSKQIGTQMAIDGLSIDEVRANAVGLWQQLEPSKNITRYDNQEHKNKGFDKLNNEIWTKGIYDSYKETMKTQLEQQQEQATSEEVLNPQLEAIDDNTNILLDTIDSFNANEQVSQQVKESLLESAERYGFKGKTLNEIQDLMEKRGISSRFDDTQFNDSRVGSFYDPDNNEIVFNPNASEEQIIQELAVHEWYHDLKQNNTEEATKIQEDIINYLKRNNQYADIRKNLEKTYIEQGYDKNRPDFTDMIDEEATAKALQQVLGNEEEIQRLNNYNRNLARRIYDAVVNLLNKFTGGRNEKLFWTNVRNNFERVFNTPGTINENNQSNNQKRLSTDTESQEKGSFNLPKTDNQGNSNIYATNKDYYNSKPKEGTIRLYTNTASNNIESILKDGLKVDKAKELEYEGKMTWFETRPDLKGYGGTTIAVDVPSNISMEKLNGTQYGVYEDISPENIVFIDKPIFNNLRTSDLQNYSDKYGKDKVLEVYDKALDNNKYISREELVSLLDNIDSNTSNQPTTDNQGRELSKGQQEFFKDSQARDENGNLIEMYHGTNENFTVFDKNGKGKRFTNFGTEYDTDVKGFFFTSNKSYAEEFGNVKPYYLNTKKILKLDNNIDDLNKIFQPMLEDMLNNQDITKTQYDAIIENGTTYKRFIDEDGIDWDIIDEEAFNDSIKIMRELGYDSIAVNEGDDNTSIMVFNSNQIKNIDNTNPTDNPDIRYSVSTTNLPAKQQKDNQGRQLSKQQQEYFKNSKVRDENGNLLEVYHGTKTNGINVFKYNKKKQTGTDYGKAFYFTSDYTKAQGYQYDIENDPAYKEYSKKDEEYKNWVFEKNISEEERSKRIKEWSNWHEKNSVFDILNNENFTPERLPKGETKKVYLNLTNPYIADAKGEYYSNVYDKYFKEAKENGNDGIIVKNVIDVARGEHKPIDVYIAFNENQIKNVDNLNPTKNKDIRYSKNTQDYDSWIKENLPNLGNKKTKLSDLKVPTKKQTNLPVQKLSADTTPGEQIDYSQIERPKNGKKMKKTFKSIIESDYTSQEAKEISMELLGSDTYTPDSNEAQLRRADNLIESYGVDEMLDNITVKADSNTEKTTATDIAVGNRLIQYYSKTGEKEKLTKAIQSTALLGTNAGQQVQAMSLIKRLSPEGQALYLQREVTKFNDKLARRKGGDIVIDENGNQRVITKNGKDITDKVKLFDLTPDMLQRITNATEGNLETTIDQIYEELGQQVPLNILEQLDEWRYFSMLANVRTHARNSIGNLAMHFLQYGIKDKIGAVGESIANVFDKDMERTKTLKPASKETKQFVINDLSDSGVKTRLGLQEDKYNPKSRLAQSRKTFKSDLLNKTLGELFNVNSKALEFEDGLGLKAGYYKAMTNYITANNIDVNNMTDAQLEKARAYAIQSAQESTFHQASALATAIDQFANKNRFFKLTTDALIPFKKTPINVAKTGFAYSPAGLVRSIYDISQLRKGNITVNQYIDNMSKGLTGTGVAVLGMALAKAGLLKASGDDDKDKENYEEQQGLQQYSLKIGDKTYSLDWLAPAGMALFVGAEIEHELSKDTETTTVEEENSKIDKIVKRIGQNLNSMTNVINPMNEMSMISGLTSALQSYNSSNSSGSIADIFTSSAKSYIGQYVPTVLGQFAKTTDEYERSTKSTKTGTVEKAVDQLGNQIKSKIPGLRQTLPIKTDIWGKDMKQEANLPLRAFNNFINPATVKNISDNTVDSELNKLYAQNQNSGILPDVLDKTFTIDGQKYRMNNKQYAEATKSYGETSYKMIETLVKSNDYKNMTTEQKEQAIENIYSYAKEQNKLKYAKQKGLEVEETTLSKGLNEVKKQGGNPSQYLTYTVKTKGMEKSEQKNYLANTNFSNKTKQIIYENTVGKDDDFYLNTDTILDINEYLNYKTAGLTSDKDENGKTIKNSLKNNKTEWINQNISGYENRLLLMAEDYKLSRAEQETLLGYINMQSNAEDIFNLLDKNYTVKNGRVYYK